MKDEVIKSEELAVPTIFNNEREQSQRPQTIRGKIVKAILDITNRSSSVSSIPNAVEENIEEQMQVKHIEEQNNTQETPLNVAEKSGNKEHTVTPGGDSDSGVSSREPSEESLESPINSRRSSISSTLSSAGEGDDPVLSEQIAEKSHRCKKMKTQMVKRGKFQAKLRES